MKTMKWVRNSSVFLAVLLLFASVAISGPVFTNNATTTIANAGGISSLATSLTVATGTGALFPTTTTTDYFYATLVDSSRNREIVKVIARAGDVFTIVRAQEGTTARTWALGDIVDLRLTAGTIQTMIHTMPGWKYCDPDAADQGVAGTNTLKSLIDAAGTDTETIVFKRHDSGATTTYTLGTSETVPANITLYFEPGAYVSVSAGQTLTIYSPANIKSTPTQHIFTGTVAFSSGSGNIYPEWWGSNTVPGTTDMTAEITAAATAAAGAGYTYQPAGSWYVGAPPKVVFQPQKYLISDTPTGWSAYSIIEGNGATIIQSTAAKDIFDFVNGYKILVNGPLNLSGGNTQLRIGNANTGQSYIELNEVHFHYNNNDYAFETYLVAPATNLSMSVILNNCHFQHVYQAMYVEAGVHAIYKDGWIQTTFSATALSNRAVFVNKGNLVIKNMLGVPTFPTMLTGARWVDNYGEVSILDGTRLGGEGSGMPVVYQYDVTRTNYTDGGAIRIHNSNVAPGSGLVKQTIVHLVDGVPSLISIKDNERLYITTGSIISVEGGFDVAAYLAALNAVDKVFIDISNNSSYLPLEYLGLPSELLADKKRVRIGRGFAPYALGGKKQSLLHFDGANASTLITDEYFSYWTVAGNAALTTINPRFLGSSLSLPNATSYIKNDAGITDIGDSFTFEFWFRITDNTANGYLFKSIAATYGIILYHVGASNKLALYASSDGASWDIADGTGGGLGTKNDYANDTWYKVVLEFTGTRYSVYVGTAGAIVAEDIGVASTDSICAVNKMYIGSNVTGLVGAIAEFRMLLDDYRYGGLFIPEPEPFKVN
jgi:hypothetical protein